MTVKEVIEFFSGRKEHYEISDDFIKSGYQQNKNSGYMDDARKGGLEINADKAEPNQKWHFVENYLKVKIAEGTLKDDDDASKCYKCICPELVLWIAEAAGIDKAKVEAVANEAKRIIDNGVNGYARNTAGRQIKKKIQWTAIEESIKNQN